MSTVLVTPTRSTSSWAGFGVFVRKELGESLRTSRIFIVAAIFLVFGLISPLLARYAADFAKIGSTGPTISLPTPTAEDAIIQFLKNVGANGVIVVVLLTMGIVAREKERGTAAFVLTKPLTRFAFLAAKFAALIVTLGIGITIAGAAAYVYTAMLFKPTALPGFAACCVLLLGQMTVYGSLTFFGSTVVKSSLPAAGIGAAAIVVFALIGLIPSVVDFTPAGLSNAAGELALSQSAPHLAGALLANGIVTGAALFLAWRSFRAQEQWGN
jgi:ABC-2 type transport system permease protein